MKLCRLISLNLQMSPQGRVTFCDRQAPTKCPRTWGFHCCFSENSVSDRTSWTVRKGVAIDVVLVQYLKGYGIKFVVVAESPS